MEATAERGDKDVLPNQYTYNIYLQSLAKQRTPWCADEAERMLKFLNEKSMDPGREELQPDVLTYTNVLHAIAVSGAEDSFHRAYSIMQEMEEGDMDVRPNVYTYNVIINAGKFMKCDNVVAIIVVLETCTGSDLFFSCEVKNSRQGEDCGSTLTKNERSVDCTDHDNTKQYPERVRILGQRLRESARNP
jgi:hypothetical protein